MGNGKNFLFLYALGVCQGDCDDDSDCEVRDTLAIVYEKGLEKEQTNKYIDTKLVVFQHHISTQNALHQC